MSTVNDALSYQLANYAGLTALVSDRIYHLVAEQGAEVPYVDYSIITAPEEHAMGSDPGLIFSRYQVRCFAETPLVMNQVFVQVKAALQRWRGTVLGVVIQDTLVEEGPELYDQDARIHYRPLFATVINEG